MDVNNGIVRALNKLTDLLVLNLLFLVCCLPVVTAGAALTAMYAVSLRSVRYGDGYVVRTFFASFKENLKQSTAAWLICLAIGALAFIDLRFFGQIELGGFSRYMKLIVLAILIFVWMVCIWLFPLIAKMRDSLKTQIANAAKMAVAYFFPYTAACMIIQGAAVYLAIINLGMMMMMLVLGFAGVSYICSFFIYKVFARLIKEEPASEDDPLYPAE